MTNKTLSGLVTGAAIATAPLPTAALDLTDGAYCKRAPGSVCAVPLVWTRSGQYQRARVILEQYDQKDVYRVILRTEDTLNSALEALQTVKPEATIDALAKENNLNDGKLPLLTWDEKDKHWYGSITYTVKVEPNAPAK